MTDRAYQNALRRRAELQKALAEVDEFIRMWRRFAGTEPEQDVAKMDDNAGQSSPISERGLSREAVGEWAREFMLERGTPMTRGELVEAFHMRGLPIGGVDPARNMGTIMWRLREDFVNIVGHGYWPRDKACPSVEYDPSDPNSPEAISHTLDLDRPTTN